MSDPMFRKAAPAYLKIMLDLKRRIDSGVFSPNQPILSEREICDEYKVSRITARRALDELEKQNYIERIQGKGSFIRAPRNIVRSARRIALVVDGIYDQGTLPIILRGIEQEAHQSGYQITFFNSQCQFDKYEEVAKMILQGEFDGVILDPIQSDREYERNLELIDRLEAESIPVILIQKYLFNHPERYSYVISEDYRGAYYLTEHLIRIGHRRIAFVHDEFNSGSFARMQGYKGALLVGNLELNDRLIHHIHNISEVPSIIESYLKMNEEEAPTAVFCVNDLLAYEFMRVLRKKEVSIPERLALVGFDDLPSSALLAVPLTTVAQQIEEIGVQAVRALKHRMNGHQTEKIQIVLPCKLVIRQSCGARRQPVPIAAA